jgi:hypothetical protein
MLSVSACSTTDQLLLRHVERGLIEVLVQTTIVLKALRKVTVTDVMGDG